MKSMTGYGRAQGRVTGRDVTVEVRCYNHRYKDIKLRLAHGWTALEVPAEKLIRAWLGRGRVECQVRSANASAGLARPELNMEAAGEYLELFGSLAREVERQTGLVQKPSLEMLARAEGVVVLDEMLADPAAAWADLGGLIEAALEQAQQMRRAEGERLAEEMEKRLDGVAELAVEVRRLLPKENQALFERMGERVQTLAAKVDVTQERLAQEVAILADRMDVTEELDRMDSHLDQFKKLMTRADPVGRELDFLLQELNREVNTLSSKTRSAEVLKLAVTLKAEIEKIREQIQNVE
ncbi:MAG TPA: YicC/YloC family endoribonuclease [Myxococcota bacterium]|nr:YicC/YloC family endoribonuclease [Myxococcota bacterium]